MISLKWRELLLKLDKKGTNPQPHLKLHATRNPTLNNMNKVQHDVGKFEYSEPYDSKNRMPFLTCAIHFCNK